MSIVMKIRENRIVFFAIMAPKLEGKSGKQGEKRSGSPVESSNESETSVATTSSVATMNSNLVPALGPPASEVQSSDGSTGAEEKKFVTDVHSFMSSQGTPVGKMPLVSDRPIAENASPQSGNLKRKINATSPEPTEARKSPASLSAEKPQADATPGTSKEPEACLPNTEYFFDDLLTVVDPHKLSEDVKHLIVDGFRSQSVQLTRISSQLDEMKNMIKQLNGEAANNFIKINDFEMKWNLILPIRTLDYFQMFDQKLTADKKFRDEAINRMWGVADSGVPFVTSVRAILKKFMTGDLTQHFTTVKDVGKQILRKTMFYSCIQAVILAKCRTNEGSPISFEEFEHAVSKVMNSSVEWGKNRPNRYTIQHSAF